MEQYMPKAAVVKEIYGLMTDEEEKEWDRQREEMHELYIEESKQTNIKFGVKYTCTKSFELIVKSYYGDFCSHFTKGKEYNCIFPNQLIDDYNCRISVPNEYQKYFVPLAEE